MSLDEVERWDNAKVLDWLDKVGLDRWKDIFEKNGVDGKALHNLSSDDLKSFGIKSGLQRKKILRLTEDFKAESRRATMTIRAMDLKKTVLEEERRQAKENKKKKKKHREEIRFKNSAMNHPEDDTPAAKAEKPMTAKAKRRAGTSPKKTPKMMVIAENEDGRTEFDQLMFDLCEDYGDANAQLHKDQFMQMLLDGGWEENLAKRARGAFKKPGGLQKLTKFFKTGERMDPTKTGELITCLTQRIKDKKAKAAFTTGVDDQVKRQMSINQYKNAADYHPDTHFDPNDPFKSYDWSRSVDLEQTLMKGVDAGTVNEAMEKYKEVFNFFDQDQNGVIDIGELTEALREVRGRHVTELEARAALRTTAMTNRDTLVFEEFVRLLEVENMDLQKSDDEEKERKAARKAYMRKRREGAGIIDKGGSTKITLDLDTMMGELPNAWGELEANLEEAQKNQDYEKCIALREKMKQLRETLMKDGPPASRWGENKVVTWLKEEELDKYADLFQKNKVDGIALLALSKEKLTAWGISRLQSKKLIREIDRLKQQR